MAVCLYHFFWELFGARFPEFRNPVAAAICDGRLAVSVFFVLTGYVLTLGHWGDVPKRSVRQQLAKRYFRLTIPVIFATTVVFILMVLGLASHTADARAIVARQDWIGGWLHFAPSPLSATIFALGTEYAPYPIGPNYNVFLWTMPYELLGSYVVLGICAVKVGVRFSAALLLIIGALFIAAGDFAALGACFVFGAVLAILRQRRQFARTTSWAPVAALVIAVVVGGFVQLMSWPVWPIVLCAVAVVAATILSERIAAVLRVPASQWLGRLSYPIYLMQFPVIACLSATLIVGAEAGGFLTAPVAVAIALVSLIATIVVAIPFVWVERLTNEAGRLVVHFFWPRTAA